MAGGRLSGGGDDDPMVEINIVPFVDIVLVVMIIFMVTARLITAPSIKVNLPDAATGDAQEPTSLGITVGPAGELLLDGDAITKDALRAAVATAYAKDPDVVCLIAGDENARHGDVTQVIDLVKQVGVTKFAINVDAVPAAP